MRGSINIIILAVALLIGGTAAVLTRGWLVSHTGTTQAAPANTIVVASEPLTFGSQLTTENVTEMAWPSPTLPDGAFSTVAELLKGGRRVVLSPLVRNEPVVASKVAGPGQKGSLSALIEAGKRAVTVPVDDVRGVAGFIFPGDFVDVVLTRTNNNNGPQNFSEVILQHVKVLAIDQTAGDRQEKPTVAKAVTVELTSEQSLKILLATNIGKLSLILRQSDEKVGSGPNERIMEKDLFQSEAPAAVAEAAPPVPVPEPAQAVAQPAPPPPPVIEPAPPAPVVEAAPVTKVAYTRTVTVVRAMKRDDYEVVKDGVHP